MMLCHEVVHLILAHEVQALDILAVFCPIVDNVLELCTVAVRLVEASARSMIPAVGAAEVRHADVCGCLQGYPALQIPRAWHGLAVRHDDDEAHASKHGCIGYCVPSWTARAVHRNHKPAGTSCAHLRKCL